MNIPTLLRATTCAALLLAGSGKIYKVVAAELPTTVEIDQFKEQGSLTGSRNFGLLGGTITVGRFTLLIPPGALKQNATVTISIPDRSKLLCDLSISPPSANQFALPVTLVGNGVGGTIRDSSSLRMFWYDPSIADWRPIGLNAQGLVVTAQLRHFSTYCGGRGGW